MPRSLLITVLVVASVMAWIVRPGQCLAQVQVGGRVRQADILSMYVFNGSDESTFKKQLDDQTKLVVDLIAKVVSIDDSQKRKLNLAVAGDLTRFYRELEIVREKTKDLDIQNQADMQKAWQEVMPVRKRADEGILSENSLFDKVLGSVLSLEQREQYNKYLRDKEIALFKAILRAAVSDMEKSLPLTSQQRTDLIELVEKKPFPRRITRAYHAYVGVILLGRLSDQETAAILDEHQQKTFNKLKQQYEAYANGVTW